MYLRHHAIYPNSQLLADLSIMTCVVIAAVTGGLHVPAYKLAITVKARRGIGKKKKKSAQGHDLHLGSLSRRKPLMFHAHFRFSTVPGRHWGAPMNAGHVTLYTACTFGCIVPLCPACPIMQEGRCVHCVPFWSTPPQWAKAFAEHTSEFTRCPSIFSPCHPSLPASSAFVGTRDKRRQL